MNDLYLVAHKVRGEPAFDVAVKMECPICHDANSCRDYEGPTCTECEGDGFWWIIPTSGHRAYPWRTCPIVDAAAMLTDMPEGLPDHYPTRAEPDKPKLNISALIPSIPIRRRV